MYKEARQEEAGSYTLPPPIGGWNTRDALDTMPETDARDLVNLFPDTGVVRLRKGFREHATGMGSGAVQTLAEFSSAAGVKKLLAAANGEIYNCTTINVAPTSLGSGFTSNKWQTVNFRATGSNFIIFVNGEDQPKKWDGTTFSDAAYTDAGLADDASLVHIWTYKSRVYLVQKDTAAYWYTATGAATGAVTTEDLSSIFTRGGYLNWVSSWSRDSGAGVIDLFVACSSMGEVLVYTGSYPGDSAWGLVGRYFLPPPVGRRSFFHLDGELCIITKRGVIPLSRVIAATDAQQYTSVTDKIQRAFNEAAIEGGDNFGWQGVVYQEGTYALVNVPIGGTTGDGRTQQYVMNILTGAWCRFQGQQAECWAVHNDKLYFGADTGGTVFQADYGRSDDGAVISASLKSAFSYFGDRARKKRFTMARPILTGSTGTTFGIGFDVDFSDTSSVTTVVNTDLDGDTEWETGEWDVDDWVSDGADLVNTWYGISGIGRCGAIKFLFGANDISITLNATQIVYEPGNFI